MSTEEDACRSVVLEFATSLNDWEVRYHILRRLHNGQTVRESRLALVSGLTIESHLEAHRLLFDRFVYPRVRKQGSNPGQDPAYSADGRFVDVDATSIESVAFRTPRIAELITRWGHLSANGKTMFVLKKKGDRWLVDSLKRQFAENQPWNNCPI